jgi:uncharacterized coiled-coil DUF342 family protein
MSRAGIEHDLRQALAECREQRDKLVKDCSVMLNERNQFLAERNKLLAAAEAFCASRDEYPFIWTTSSAQALEALRAAAERDEEYAP